jgi:predicted nucleic acid-binding protein
MANGGPAFIDVPPADYPELSKTMQRYRERDIDFADAALVWPAEQTGNRSIFTVNDADFQRFRLRGGAGLEILEWRT